MAWNIHYHFKREEWEHREIPARSSRWNAKSCVSMSTFRNFNFKGFRWLLPSSFAGVHSEFTRVDSVPCVPLSLVPHSSVVSSLSWSPLHPKLSFLSFMWGPRGRYKGARRLTLEEKTCRCFTLASCTPLNPASFGWHCQVWLPAWDGPWAFNHISSRFLRAKNEEALLELLET